MTSLARVSTPGALLLLVLGACAGAEREDAAEASADTLAGDTAAEEAPRYLSYAILRSGDTLAVERVLRSPGQLSARIRGDTTDGGLLFEATTGAGELVRTIRMEAAEGAPGLWPGRRTTLHFDGERVITEISEGDSVRTDTLGVPTGTLPFLDTSVALVEQALFRARAVEGDTVTLSLLALGSREVRDAVVRWNTSTDVTVELGPEGRIHLTLDPDGRVERMDNDVEGVSASRLR